MIFSINPIKKVNIEIVLTLMVVLGCLKESASSPIPETSKNENDPIVNTILFSVGA